MPPYRGIRCLPQALLLLALLVVLPLRPAAANGPRSAPNYLIITADAYQAGLAGFVSLKQSQGFNVTVAPLRKTGAAKEQIKSFIAAQYAGANRPDYLLLVGDVNNGADSLPAWPFKTYANFYTDLYYATMDGNSDYLPDILVGRWPVRTTAQLANLVSNQLAYSGVSGTEAWVKTAAFIATDDASYAATAEGAHNAVIQDRTTPLGYTGTFPNHPQPGGDRLYAVSYAAGSSEVRAALNAGRGLVVYNGYGSQTSWSGPLLTQADVRALEAPPIPLVAGFAGYTADYNADESFAETWLVQAGKGALAYLGASNATDWDRNALLEKELYKALLSDPLHPPSLAQAVAQAQEVFRIVYPDDARYYREAYNLFGDPSLELVLAPRAADFALHLEPPQPETCQSGQPFAALSLSALNGFQSPVILSANHAALQFSANPLTPPGTSSLSLSGTLPPAGTLPLTITGTSGALVRTLNFELVLPAPPSAIPTLSAPADLAVNQSLRPTFVWTAAPGASRYNLQIAASADFSAPLVFAQNGIETTSFSLPFDLEAGALVYWRVQAENACGSTDFSAASRFRTIPGQGDCPAGMFPAVLSAADFESAPAGWSLDGSGGSWSLSSSSAHSPASSYLAAAPVTASDQRLISPDVALPALELPLGLSFWNRYDLETNGVSCFDAALLEISSDHGASWQPLTARRLLNQPTTGTIVSLYGNPLGGLQGWCGQKDWSQAWVDLNDYAGQTVRFRFRLGSDSSTASPGWWVDDFRVQSCRSYAPALAAQPESAVAAPGQSAQYALTLTNLGNTADTYTLQVSGNTWAALPAQTAFALDTGQSSTFGVEVQVPAGAAGASQDTVVLTAVSDTQPARTAVLELTTTARSYGVQLSADSTSAADAPGTDLTYPLTVTNTGNDSDTFEFSAQSSLGWQVTLPPPLTLAAGASQEVSVRVRIPVSAPAYQAETTLLQAASQDNPAASDSLSLTTTANAQWGAVLAAPTASLLVQPGESADHTLTLTNTGNLETIYQISALSAHGWGTSVPEPVSVPAGQSVQITVSVSVPADTAPGTLDELTVRAAVQAQPDVYAERVLHTAAGQYRVYLPAVRR